MRRDRLLKSSVIVISAISLQACASHLAQVPEQNYGPPGEPTAQTSFFGRSVANSNSATGLLRCGKDGYGRVHVRRNLGQGLISALTLGTVAPATIEFNCMPGNQVPDYECEKTVGVEEVVCTRNKDGDVEAVTFECEPIVEDGSVADGFTCIPQSSAWIKLLPWIAASQSARG